MSFVVDGSDWKFDGREPDLVVRALDNLLERVLTAKERGESVFIGEELQSLPVYEQYDLWSLRGGVAVLQLPSELWQELAAWLGTAEIYLDIDPWPPGFDDCLIAVDGQPATHNPDVAWVHHTIRSGLSAACLGLFRGGEHETISSLGASPVRWILDEQGHVDFWRNSIELNDCEDILERFAASAFPNLFFAQGSWRGLRDFAGSYRSVSVALRKALGVLSDHGGWIFTSPPPALRHDDQCVSTSGGTTNQIIEQRFKGYGLTVSPEAIEVYRDARCREAREVSIHDKVHYCEWHEKLQPHQNRIYFHGPVSELDGKLLIGFFSKHLPLP